MYSIDLNCDMGEGQPNDALLMPYISSANIACGYHAGDRAVMQQTVNLAIAHGVSVGAHPGFDDKENFGRTEMQLSAAEIYELVTRQIILLKEMAESTGTRLHHVKPHGALYNMSAKDPDLANTIARAVKDVSKELFLFGLSGSHSITEAKKLGLRTVSEVFADRTYQDDGSLTPRTKQNAMIESEQASLQQVLRMIQEQKVISVNGKEVSLTAETICIHGDGKHAVDFASLIFQTLQNQKIDIKTL